MAEQINYFNYDGVRENGEFVIGASISARDETQARTIIRNYFPDIKKLSITQVTTPTTRLVI